MTTATRRYNVKIKGASPLLMHCDNIEFADQMEEWKNDPANRKKSKAGDDRTPPYRWVGALYHDETVVAIPQENIMRCLMEGGAMVLVPGGRSGKTFKAQTQSGIRSEAMYWPLKTGGHVVKMADVEQVLAMETFRENRLHCQALGFDLFVKRAKVGSTKHIRVRPRFNDWTCEGILAVHDEQITDGVLRDILVYAGAHKGLGDWRSGGRTPGSWGQFTVDVKRLK